MSTPSFNLQVGQEVLLKASILDQNGNEMVYSPPQVGQMGGAPYASWSSNNTAVATVSSGPGGFRGSVFGVSAGSAVITATYTDTYGNTATQTINVTVYLPAATSIQIIYPNQ